MFSRNEIESFRRTGCKKGDNPFDLIDSYHSDEIISNEKKWQLFLTSILPTKYALEFYHWFPAKIKNKEFFENLIDKNLFLYGRPGTGKTFGAICIYLLSIQACKNNLKLRKWYNDFEFETTTSLLRKIRFNLYDKSQEEMEIKKLINVPVLILDDFGVEKSTDFANTTLEDILNERYNNLRLTTITSNYDPDTLSKKIGSKRIVSRILESGESIKFDEILRGR